MSTQGGIEKMFLTTLIEKEKLSKYLSAKSVNVI